jgi:predicted transcriptional regulator
MTPTLTQVRTALCILAQRKGRPDYELCTAKAVRYALENGLEHHLIGELRGLIQERTIPQDITQDKKVSHARLVKHRDYPTAEQAKDIVDWIRSYGGHLVDVARIAGCAHSTLSLIRSGTKRSFTLDMYNKIMKARKELEGMA